MKHETLIEKIKDATSIGTDTVVGYYDQQYVPKFHAVSNIDIHYQVRIGGNVITTKDNESDAYDVVDNELVECFTEALGDGDAARTIVAKVRAYCELETLVSRLCDGNPLPTVCPVIVLS